LPPAPEGAPAIGDFVETAHDAGAMLKPGLPATPAEQMAHAKLEDYTVDSSELAEWVPTSPSLTDAAQAAPAAAGEESFAWDGSQDAAVGSSDEGKEFKLDTDLGIDIDLASLDFAPTHETGGGGVADEYGAQDIPDMPDLPSGEGVRFSTFENDSSAESMGDLDADVAALAAQLEAFEKNDTRRAPTEPEFTRTKTKDDEAADLAAPAVMPKGTAKVAEKPAPASAAATAAAKAAKDAFDFSNLSLSPMDAEAALAKAPPIEPKFGKAAAPASAPAPAPAKSSFGELSLEGESDAAPMMASAPASSAGAVLVLAGLGGPDAVRQLLSTLPPRLSVPVLLYQHLEVGKHERLVEQLAKISKLPVVLAREGDAPVAGKVTLLPAGMTAIAGAGGIKFGPGSLSQLVTSLPPADSMVIVLSGADAQLVPMILAVKDGGGSVFAQDPELCFDAAAAEAMRKEGAPVYPALGLAQQVAARWPA
jgi:chemotaxis response regulator CheB